MCEITPLSSNGDETETDTHFNGPCMHKIFGIKIPPAI